MNEIKSSRRYRGAVPSEAIGDVRVPINANAKSKRLNILIVDLNNFANFPTMAIGLLIASLRNQGHSVKLVCPLAFGAAASERERKEGMRQHLMRRVHFTQRPWLRGARDALRGLRYWWINKPSFIAIREAKRAIAEEDYDAVLLSAYLQHYPLTKKIGAICKEKGVPLLLGGPMFNVPNTAQSWLDVPGLKAVYGGEADKEIVPLVEALCDGSDLLQFPGITLPDGRSSGSVRPLRPLDAIAVPDYHDFPWDRYPTKIIPVMTGRGCQWDKCVFCSDVISASGRTFRTRSVENVMQELEEHARRYATNNFLFLDLKLNSNPAMFHGISEEIQHWVPGAQWIGTVHVDQRKDNGLTRRDLKAAVSGGMRRISFGLESGSQKMLDLMHKGCDVERNSEFIRNAHEAGLSVRCTMFLGFPGETAEDVDLTAKFLEDHKQYLDRVRFNAFSVMEDTPIYKALYERAPEVSSIKLKTIDHKRAKASYIHSNMNEKHYRQAKLRALNVVHQINSKKVRVAARAFDGLM